MPEYGLSWKANRWRLLLAPYDNRRDTFVEERFPVFEERKWIAWNTRVHRNFARLESLQSANKGEREAFVSVSIPGHSLSVGLRAP